MSTGNNATTSPGSTTETTKGASSSVTAISEISKQTDKDSNPGSDATNSRATASASEVNNTSTLSLTDTIIYTTYSLAQLESWITMYHEEAALIRNKIRPLTDAEAAIFEKLLAQRRGVENSMIHKKKYEEFMAKEKAKKHGESS